MPPELPNRNVEQARIQNIIYLNLDRLFKELDELNQETTEKEAGLKKN